MEVSYGTTTEKLYQTTTHVGPVLIALQANVKVGPLVLRKVDHRLPESLLCSSLSLNLSLRRGSGEHLELGLVVGVVVSGMDDIVIKHMILLPEQGFLSSSLFVLNFLSSLGYISACDSRWYHDGCSPRAPLGKCSRDPHGAHDPRSLA